MKTIGPNQIHGIILAAGKGRRHRGLTSPYNRYARPKGMLPIGNRVLIDFSIEALKNLGLPQLHVGINRLPISESTGRPVSERLAEHVADRDAYGIDVRVHTETKILDTAGTVNFILSDCIGGVKRDDTVVVLPCDTPHNIDLAPMLSAHLARQSAVTIAVLPITWSSPEWSQRSFGTVELDVMPKVTDYTNKERGLFEEDLKRCASSLQGETHRIQGFDEEQGRDKARSNLINTGIYFFRAGFLMDLAPSLTPRDSERRFSDFGLHVFPLLAGRYEEFSQHPIDPGFLQNIKNGRYPFYSYILSPDVYWRDVVDPLALLRANMDVLLGRLDTHLREDAKFWRKMDWGWKGLWGKDPQGEITPPPPGSIGSIIGSNVDIVKGAKIVNSIVLDHNEIAGEVVNSVVFPGSLGEKGLIGKGVNINDTLFVGGQLRHGDTWRRITDVLIYGNCYDGICRDPLK